MSLSDKSEVFALPHASSNSERRRNRLPLEVVAADEPRRTCGGGAQPTAAGVRVAVAAGRVVRDQIPGGRRALVVVGASGPGIRSR